MSEDNVVPFKREADKIVWSDGTEQTECSDLVHIFPKPEGSCLCGAHQWDMDASDDWVTVADFRTPPTSA